MMKKGMLINPSGFVEMVEFPTELPVEERLRWYYDVLGCDLVTFVQPYGLEAIAKEYGLKSYIGKYCMICDDEALLKEQPHANPVASLLYGVLNHGQPLFGKVLVAKNEETIDGMDTVGLDEEDAKALMVSIDTLISGYNERVREG